MAIWQFDVLFVEGGGPPPIQAVDGWDVAPLPESLIGRALILLNQRLGTPESITDDWIVFGSENGNRVDVAVAEAGHGDVSARVDARVEARPFVEFLADLADALDCVLFNPASGDFIAANQRALLVAFETSQAAAFCEAPREFVRKLHSGQ